jgi:RHS repeat-associated protein
VQENSYYPFGAPINDLSWTPKSTNRYLREGKEYISDFDWNKYDYSARYYDPYVARFLNTDPMAGNYYNISPYAFVAGNPINLIDPTGMFYDWVRNLETDEYVWMDNVTSQVNTPEGYVYVGADDKDILEDMNVKANYETKTQTNYGAAAVSGDNIGPSGAGIPAPAGRKATGNISISVNVAYSTENTTENNKNGKTFEGITVTGSLSQVASNIEGNSMIASGYLSVANGNKTYESIFKTPTGEYVRATGINLTVSSIHIPACEITSLKALSRAIIRAGNTNNTIISFPIKMNWNLQTRPVFRPIK